MHTHTHGEPAYNLLTPSQKDVAGIEQSPLNPLGYTHDSSLIPIYFLHMHNQGTLPLILSFPKLE